MHLLNSVRHFPDLYQLNRETGSTPPEKPKSSLRCALVVVILALLGTAVVLLPLMLLKQTGIAEHREIGESHGFLKAALQIKESLNTDVNPCDDFYEYVCGNYIKNNPLRPGEWRISEIAKTSENTEYQLKKLLGSLERTSSYAINKMKLIFNVCVMEEQYMDRTPTVAMEGIKGAGHWPIVMGDQNGNIDVQKAFEQFILIGVENVWMIYETRDQKDKSKFILRFEQGKPLIDWRFYQNETRFAKEIAAHKKRIRSRIQQFTKDNGYPENPNLDRDLVDFFKFDADVAKIMRDPKIKVPIAKAYNPEVFDTFNERMKADMGVDIKTAEVAMIPEFARGLFTPETMILVEDPKFAENLAKIVKQLKPETFVNYILYTAMSKYNDFFGLKYREFDQILHQELYGTPGDYDIWNTCKPVALKMKKAVGALYARNHFDQESREIMMEMVGNLKAAFMEMVDESDWMDEETTKAAKNKAKEMIPHIGYGELAFDDAKLDEYYKDIDVSNYNDFFALLESVDEWEKNKFFRKLTLPNDRTEFFDVSSTVNAFFAADLNAILFPAAFLQFPFFVKDQPQSMNYGSIGSVIGHEITHGFDNTGKNYDEYGQLRNWWAEDTLKKFDERSKCMEEQYSSVEVEGMEGIRLNGRKTLGENIADNGGIREAYKAYKKYVKHHGEEKKMPGVSLTDDQLFFVGYANGYCSAMRPMMLLQQIFGDEHSPDKYRTNIVMQNMKEFSNVFNCPVGSPMNPEKQCRVW